MKLLINAGGNLYGGGLQVAISFIYECKNFNNHEYHVFLGPNIQNHIKYDEFPINFHFYKIPQLPFYRKQKIFSKLELNINQDVVFTIFGPAYWRPQSPHLVGYAQPYYTYPESPFIQNLSWVSKIKLFAKKKMHFYYLKRDCDFFVCETTDVTQRLKKLCAFKNPNKGYATVSNTCGTQYFNIISNINIKRLPPKKTGEIRLLTVSKYYPHKNIEIIKNVLDELSKEDRKYILFILTISIEEYQKIFGDKYRDNVVTVGVVPPQECPSLYKECDIMFLPTLVECFSASYVEAMVMEKPILTSDLGFAHSICKDAALYFDPLNAESIIARIKEIRNSLILKQQLIEKGKKRSKYFPTATQRAGQYLEICKNIIDKR